MQFKVTTPIEELKVEKIQKIRTKSEELLRTVVSESEHLHLLTSIVLLLLEESKIVLPVVGNMKKQLKEIHAISSKEYTAIQAISSAKSIADIRDIISVFYKK